MDRIQNKNQKIMLNLIYSSIVFTLVYILGLGIDLELNIVLQILAVSIGSMIVKLFLFNPLILYVLLFIGFLIVMLVNHFISPILFILTEKIFYLLGNIIGNIQGKENIASENLLLFWGIIIVLVSLFTAFIVFKSKSIYLLLPVYMGFFLYYWYSFFDEAYLMVSIFLLLFLVLMGLDKYSKGKIQFEYLNKFYAPWLQTLTMYSILIVFISLILPKSNNYIQWSWLQEKVYNTFPVVEELRSYNVYNRKSGSADLFNFSNTGYQENLSRLGGPVNLSSKKIMTVRGDSRMYLRGNVKQFYTGDYWSGITEPFKDYRLRQDFSGLSKWEKENYYNQKSITIINHSFASTTIFSPYQATKVNFDGSHIIRVNRDNSLFFPNGVYNREGYTVHIQEPLPYGILLSLGINRKKEDIKDLKTYLQTPEDVITERTKVLVGEIVKNEDDDFKKALAIEDYLRNNYQYNLNVKELPKNKEFIDHFLFDEKEGYCTYYATAMAIMLRLEGIPSRYIEGYLAQDLVEPETYEVKYKDAHAWVEAFIEPVGWMTFEPTPAYPIQDRLENYRIDISNDNGNHNEPTVNSRNPTRDNNEDIIDERQIPMGGENGSNYQAEYGNKTTKLRKNTGYIFIGILLLIIPIRFLIGFSYYIYRELKAKKLSNKKRIIYLYGQILKLIESFGYPQKSGETHYEYANRVTNKFYQQRSKGIKEITAIFVRSKYSNSPTLDEEVLDLEKYKEALEKHLRSYLGLRIYYYNKYIRL